jgi:hypothetical protein
MSRGWSCMSPNMGKLLDVGDNAGQDSPRLRHVPFGKGENRALAPLDLRARPKTAGNPALLP